MSTNQSNICGFETLFDPIAIEAIIQNENIICFLINLSDHFLEAKIPQSALWWPLPFHQSSSCSIAPCHSMLFHVVPCSCVLVFILILICVINALLPRDFITRALQNLHPGYFKHIWVVAVMEASQINNDAVNTLLTALVSCVRMPLVKMLHMITFPKITFHQCYL